MPRASSFSGFKRRIVIEMASNKTKDWQLVDMTLESSIAK